jgi:hypothetical protein
MHRALERRHSSRFIRFGIRASWALRPLSHLMANETSRSSSILRGIQ